MVEQRFLQKILRAKLAELQLKNSAYSQRAFARKLGVSSAALSEILAGKRRVSAAVATRICARLGAEPDLRDKLLSLFTQPAARRRRRKLATTEGVRALRLEADQFSCIADWYHFAILSLAETEGFVSDPAWMASRLNVPQTVITHALDRLERLRLMSRDALGQWHCTGTSYTTPDEVLNLSIQRSHAQGLELARQSLERDAVSERDFTSVTATIDPMQLPEIKRLIREFRDKLASYVESGAKKEVYRFSFQTIPLTRPLN